MTAVAEEVKAEDGKAEPEKNHFYCEICQISCLCAISLQSHYRGAKHRKCLLNLSAFLNQVDQECPKMRICTGKSGSVSPVLREVLQAELTTYWTLKNQDTRMIWENALF